ncbi:hypothetical protein GOP47_0005435 [Adiantum capillus-veneris]|uniref:rhamnogalacturonan endolyase n=1 Tax=Adiantum capillus-veneris TaxID=13818 RepID=A0A9D4V608_ADICA|nr:hypothetical protein GOP47_0005435 [Adiantum capillus-veneris]
MFRRSSREVRLIDKGNHIVLDNGILAVTLSKPGGLVTCLQYGGLENLLEVANRETNRGYWDLNWNEPGGHDNFDVIYGTTYNIIRESPSLVEVSFLRQYVHDNNSTMVPLNIDKRFVLLRGNSGFYSYAIYERPAGWPDFNLNQTRIAFKLRKDKFCYMAMADTKQRIMPSPEDLMPNNCEKLAYPEAVILKSPKNPNLRGEVDDKYQYSCDNRENRVHGWISTSPSVGFWIITVSDEFKNGGILKQNLTSHVGPTCLSVFHSAHFAGDALCSKFRQGEAWKKVFGPVYIYLNSCLKGAHFSRLWHDAKQQMLLEMESWPYSWPCSSDYPKAHERGTVSGRLLVRDRFFSSTMMCGTHAFLGLAIAGELGSWQTESKGYQFWTQANKDGFFNIKSVRAGEYSLYGWVPGVLGDYKLESIIKVTPGLVVNLGDITFEPPRHGKTVWEIGIPDRTAAEFFVPETNRKYVNRLFVNHPERYRQYGLWERYTEMYPTTDLIYTVGSSDWRQDWFFAHVCRIQEDGTLQPATWQVKFHLNEVNHAGVYKLRLALAASSNAAIQVRFNDPSIYKPHFDTMQTGKDNAIARHGIHGLYHLFNVDVSPQVLHEDMGQLEEQPSLQSSAHTHSTTISTLIDMELWRSKRPRSRRGRLQQCVYQYLLFEVSITSS